MAKDSEPTLEDRAKAGVLFGKLWTEMTQSYCDKIAETFSSMQIKSVQVPFREQQP